VYRLYYVFLPDCAACKASKPEVEAWAAAHPWVKLVPFDYSRQEWKADGWHPTVVPTLILLEPNRRWHAQEFKRGRVTQAGIDAWLGKVCPMALAPPGREA